MKQPRASINPSAGTRPQARPDCDGKGRGAFYAALSQQVDQLQAHADRLKAEPTSRGYQRALLRLHDARHALLLAELN